MTKEVYYQDEADILWNSYFYPNSDVLKNKLNIIDSEELREAEAEITFEKLVELYEEPIKGNFDAEHLKAIHRYLFEDIYDWAGIYRNVDMQKATGFTNHNDIDRFLKGELALMNEEFASVTNEYALAAFLATYYAQLMIIHPFREGNGRAGREFLREFVFEKTKNTSFGSYEIDWTKFDGEAMLKDIQFSLVFRGVMEREFQKALVRVDIDNQIKM